MTHMASDATLEAVLLVVAPVRALDALLLYSTTCPELMQLHLALPSWLRAGECSVSVITEGLVLSVNFSSCPITERGH